MRDIRLIAHDIRSTHNVGSLLRTADGLGVSHVYLTGYTPYPPRTNDNRLPHISEKLGRQIEKTALGATRFVPWSHDADIMSLLKQLRSQGFTIAALEQTDSSQKLSDFSPPQKLAILLGREVEGIDQELLSLCDITLEIPMLGKKESFNVVQAAAMVLYHCRFL
jgi:tRNA G18 (ribose-2'-O)-methylase SpoU